MAILYTQSQVNNALLRGQVAMYVISENIEDGFMYFYPQQYALYKALQYDIYTLFNVVYNESSFVTYASMPTLYEYMFYEVVGSLINKTKQVDVFGEFGGTTNSNYQAPGTIIVVPTPPGIFAIEFSIPAGSTWPFPYPYTQSTQPDVTYLIPDGSGGLTGNGTSRMYYDLIGGVMRIYGNNNGNPTPGFNETTYVRITV